MIELPPLPHQFVRDPRHQAHEARERILMARIAELEADAVRYEPIATLDEALGCFYWLSEKGHSSFPKVYIKRDST